MKIAIGHEIRDASPDEEAAILAQQAIDSVPQPEPVPQLISRRQFYHGLAVSEQISKAEALDAIRMGALPAAIQSMVDGMMDADAKFEAEMLLIGASEFHRDHPLVLVFAEAQDLSEAEVDDFWRLCAAL